jgi:hypothetical protein
MTLVASPSLMPDLQIMITAARQGRGQELSEKQFVGQR